MYGVDGVGLVEDEENGTAPLADVDVDIEVVIGCREKYKALQTS